MFFRRAAVQHPVPYVKAVVILLVCAAAVGCRHAPSAAPGSPYASSGVETAGKQPSAALSPAGGAPWYAPGALTTLEMTASYAAQPYRPLALAAPAPAQPQADSAESGKVAYLTFDDGPSRNTGAILRILKEEGVRATFFVIGRDDAEGIQRYKDIAADGHVLGNHTYSHRYDKVYRSAQAFENDVEALGNLLEKTVGHRPDLLRFPGGSNNHPSRHYGGTGVMRELARRMTDKGFVYYDWNVSSTDAAAVTCRASDILQAVKTNSEGKRQAVILLHDADAKTTTVEALPGIIRYLKLQGYAFAGLDRRVGSFQFLKP